MKYFFVYGLVLSSVLFFLLSATAEAQSMLTVDLNAGAFHWSWTPAPSGETGTSFHLKCGSATGVYGIVKDTGNVTVFTVPVNNVVTTPGAYFCVVTTFAATTGLESTPSNEVNFRAALPPSAPSALTVQPD